MHSNQRLVLQFYDLFKYRMSSVIPLSVAKLSIASVKTVVRKKMFFKPICVLIFDKQYVLTAKLLETSSCFAKSKVFKHLRFSWI